MTKGQKALQEIKNICFSYGFVKDVYKEQCDIIEKDLDRSEKLDKAKALIKKKHINVLNLLHFSRDYPKNSCLSIYNKNVAIELTQDEFDLIVEVFDNDNNPHLVKTTDENIKLDSKLEYFKPDDLYFNPDEEERMIIELAKENMQLRDCIVELNLQLIKLKKGVEVEENENI